MIDSGVTDFVSPLCRWAIGKRF